MGHNESVWEQEESKYTRATVRHNMVTGSWDIATWSHGLCEGLILSCNIRGLGCKYVHTRS